MSDNTSTKVTAGAGVTLAILAIIISLGLMGQQGYYVCQDPQMAIQCDSLSKININGTQTNCYFKSEENKSTYKQCKSGWIEYIPEKQSEIKNTTEINNSIELCKVYNYSQSSLIKECKNDKDEVVLYWIG